MAHTSFRASAPGSLMLLGEHAVLHGRQALVCAVSRRITVTLEPREDDHIHLQSALGSYDTTLGQLSDKSGPFRFVLAAIANQKVPLESGFDLDIQSEFSSTVGLGSSAAVTVATTAALASWLEGPLAPRSLYDRSVAVIREVQGLGSGADVAASVFGGVVAYRMKPIAIRKVNSTPPIVLVYSGHKEPTVDVVNRVEMSRKAQPKLFNAIYDVMDQSVPLATEAMESRNWPALGSLLNLNQGLMESIGVNTAGLTEIIYMLRGQPGILGAKISGAGLGDCVIGIGSAVPEGGPGEVIPVDVSTQGVTLE